MGKWYDWYENQKQWNTMLEQVNEATRSSVQERSDTHEASEKAKYDYPWKKLSMQQTALGTSGDGGSNPLSMISKLKSGKNSMRGLSDLKDLFWQRGGGGFDEGSVNGIPSDPSGYNMDWGGGGGEGSISTLGWIALVIAGQQAATNATDREFEGVETGNAFTGQFMTEPWYAMLGDQWGWEASAGEKFDASVKNADQWGAIRRLPAAADYWADPGGTYLWDAMKNQWGSAANWIDPIHGLLDLIAE